MYPKSDMFNRFIRTLKHMLKQSKAKYANPQLKLQKYDTLAPTEKSWQGT